MPKLFLYKAKNSNIVAILRRDKQRKEWQLIRWDIEVDNFQEGQWLINKMIHPRYSSISPDGKYFFYHYWNHGQYSQDAVFSKIPNFTAEYYGTWNTYYQDCTFTNDNKGVVSFEDQFIKRNVDTKLELVLRKDTNTDIILPTGYVGLKNDDTLAGKCNNYEQHATFTDMKGRVITVKEGVLYANGIVLLDTTNNTFTAVGPV
jgi:hypothetical protein